MKYNIMKKEIILERELSELDKFVLEFINILKRHVKYVIISGYVSILLGRSRGTEDVDLFLEKVGKEKFLKLYKELDEGGFWCLNTSNSGEAFDYLESPIFRVAEKDSPIPFSPVLEKYILPQEEDIIEAVEKIMSS